MLHYNRYSQDVILDGVVYRPMRNNRNYIDLPYEYTTNDIFVEKKTVISDVKEFIASRKPIEKMNYKELVDEAKRRGVTIPRNASKEDLQGLINGINTN